MKLCLFLLSSLVAEVYPGPVSVSISAVYTPAPGEAPGILGPNQFTAGSILTLRCSAQGLSGNLSYRWSVSGSSDCTRCAINVSSTTSTLDLRKLYPYFAGIYKCAVSGTGSPLSLIHHANFTVTVVGAGLSALTSDGVSSCPIANNGLVVANSKDTLVLDCVSNSSQVGVGTLTTPEGITKTPDYLNSRWQFVTPYNRPGVVRIQRLSSYTTAPFTDFGIFKFTIPDSIGHIMSFNVGIYPRGFRLAPTITSLVYKRASRTLTCVSTGSSATTITWMKDGLSTHGPSSHYTLSQTVTHRPSSTYSNVLVVEEGAPGGVTGFYSCTVSNSLGNATRVIEAADAHPVNDFKGKEISTNSLSFHWSPPSIGANLTTAYNLTCVPLLAGIPVRQSLPLPLTLAFTATMATVTKLFPGVPYNCSITTHNKYGSSRPSALSLSTFETTPSGSPEMFTAVPGEREVVFFWSPPPVTQRNGVITSYTLSCSPSPSSLPQSPSSQSGPLTVAGFSPITSYSCSLFAGNTKGSGPPSNISFITQQDTVFFQLRLGGFPGKCSDFNTTLDKEDVTAEVVKQLGISCSECSGDTIVDSQLLLCYPESPSYLTYRARLKGTSEANSSSLVSVIVEWVRGGGTCFMATNVTLTLDSSCSVVISSLSGPECAAVYSDSSYSDNDKASFDCVAAVIQAAVVAPFVFVSFAIISIVTICLVVKKCSQKPPQLPENIYEVPSIPGVPSKHLSTDSTGDYEYQ